MNRETLRQPEQEPAIIALVRRTDALLQEFELQYGTGFKPIRQNVLRLITGETVNFTGLKVTKYIPGDYNPLPITDTIKKGSRDTIIGQLALMEKFGVKQTGKFPLSYSANPAAYEEIYSILNNKLPPNAHSGNQYQVNIDKLGHGQLKNKTLESLGEFAYRLRVWRKTDATQDGGGELKLDYAYTEQTLRELKASGNQYLNKTATLREILITLESLPPIDEADI